LEAKGKGSCEIRIAVHGTDIITPPIPVNVWSIDHVLLTPRLLDIQLGKQQRVTAEVTDEDGRRSTNVLLEWKHDAADQLTVRVNAAGSVFGNRIGRTAVTAGAGDVWARIPVEVNIIPNPSETMRGSGFPRLLLTGRDHDPATGVIREGDPDQPPLWQEASDFVHNVWWLNIQSPDAAFAFQSRVESPQLWRSYHAGRLIDMVVQVWMTEEFTKKGESQRPEFWAGHLAAMDRHRVRITQEMWRRLAPYIKSAAPPTNDTNEAG
jgi:hypothetical protein